MEHCGHMQIVFDRVEFDEDYAVVHVRCGDCGVPGSLGPYFLDFGKIAWVENASENAGPAQQEDNRG